MYINVKLSIICLDPGQILTEHVTVVFILTHCERCDWDSGPAFFSPRLAHCYIISPLGTSHINVWCLVSNLQTLAENGAGQKHEVQDATFTEEPNRVPGFCANQKSVKSAYVQPIHLFFYNVSRNRKR